nr:DUF1385 domain-containing protein [Lachnospiraceae bacterium]
MKFSGIGGQAVMEGVMMRNGKEYAVAVRLPDQSVHVDKKTLEHDGETVKKIPLVRGVYSFVESLVIGMRSIMYSASFYEEEEEKKPKTKEEEEKAKRREKAEMGGTLVASFILALALFMALPFYLSRLFSTMIPSEVALAAIEGVIRVIIFIAYVILIGRTEDIKRLYMYHGAEHKCINCIEAGNDLTVENVRNASRFHKRCGTSFVFVVLLISIFVFMFIRVDTRILKLLLRLVLVPLIAGISYEF